MKYFRIREIKIILEAVMLQVKQGMEEEYEEAFREASKIISSMRGYISHELQRCMEVQGKYLLLVKWETLQDHTVESRQSKEYRAIKKHYITSITATPTVEHFEKTPL